MSNSAESNISLAFPLEVDDDWPPVAVESLPFKVTPKGYMAIVPPLFVKNISVGDLIEVRFEPESRNVVSWQHVTKSGRTTIWLLRLKRSNTIESVLARVRALGCNTTGLDEAGVYAVDVPESVAIEAVDSALAHLDENAVATAFPSMRHQE